MNDDRSNPEKSRFTGLAGEFTGKGPWPDQSGQPPMNPPVDAYPTEWTLEDYRAVDGLAPVDRDANAEEQEKAAREKLLAELRDTIAKLDESLLERQWKAAEQKAYWASKQTQQYRSHAPSRLVYASDTGWAQSASRVALLVSLGFTLVVTVWAAI